ncbi:fimbrial protein [Pseudescherichia sp.]|uniref:fimbrial protein n=1 Tax=Pseudescherichia sp. TaxID=2055881 RepID=UPI00289E3D16|nr:fimbrial protein [Pseudescherichia sp.]
MNLIWFVRSLAGTAMAILFWSSCAIAECEVTQTNVMRFTLPTISLSGGESNGSILAQVTQQIPADPVKSGVSCHSGGTMRVFATRPLVMDNETFATGVPGIGYRLFIDNQPVPWKHSIACEGEACQPSWPTSSQVELQLVRTASHAAAAGRIRPGIYGIVRGDRGKPALLITLAQGIVIENSGCNPRVQTVNLGTVGTKSFPSLLTSSNRVPFRVEFNCPLPLHLGAIWEGERDRFGLLKPLAGRGRAEGIGIRLRDDSGASITLAHPLTAQQHDKALNFSAEMVRTGEVSSGKVDAIATLHLIYK